MTDKTDTPRTRLTREQIAKIEIGRTDISRPAAWLLAACFLGVVFAVPVAQCTCELLADPSRAPQPLDIFRSLTTAAGAYRQADGSALDKALAANAAVLRAKDRFADTLEGLSFQSRWLRPHVQAKMTRWLGFGTEKAYVGRDGWLFYRPDVDHVTGPGFLERRHLARRRAEGNEYTPAPKGDPRKAILQFHDQLARRQIQLIVVPVPVKAMIHPEKFSARFDDFDRVLYNPSFERLKRELEDAGVLVFDPAPLLAKARKRTGTEQFLRTDTHWTPEAMDLVARRLVQFIDRYVKLDSHSVRYVRLPEIKVADIGDTARMLGLGRGQDFFGDEAVTIRPVLAPGTKGLMWRPRKAAQVLLLGDSFTNVYSLDAMGWGETAGLAEQLSFRMQRPVDLIARNDAGANATRLTLGRKLAAGRDRLAGKKVVIWQFAARELSVGDWKLLDMTLGKPSPSNFIATDAGTAMAVTGTVSAVSPVPRPGSVPYRDHICQVHLVELKDEAGRPMPGREALVFMWSMRNKKLTPAGRYREGRSVTLRLQAWQGEPERLHGRLNRSEFDDDEIEGILSAPLCWGEELSQ